MELLNQYIEFIQEAELLKGVLRSATHSSGRAESTAEHSWRLALFASVLLDEYPHLDHSKVLIMCLIHDLGEIYDGDIPAILQTDAAGKLDTDYKAVEKILSLLPPKLKSRYMGIWLAYAEVSSAEARLVKALRKPDAT